MDLTGQVALIIGGSRGLGRAFAQALAAAGAQVAITGRSSDELHQTAQDISTQTSQVLGIPADVTDTNAALQVVATVEQQLGPITLLVNNAGQFRAFGSVDVVEPDAWWNEIEVNVRGPFLYARAVLPGMRVRQAGRIINVASGAGTISIPKGSAYVVSKTALIRLSETMAQETAADGIRVFAIHPGTVRTPMNDYVHDAPEVAAVFPELQQSFRTTYAEGLDTPIEQSVQLVLSIAAGAADELSGYYLEVGDDFDALVVQRKDPQAVPDQRTLRIVQ